MLTELNMGRLVMVRLVTIPAPFVRSRIVERTPGVSCLSAAYALAWLLSLGCGSPQSESTPEHGLPAEFAFRTGIVTVELGGADDTPFGRIGGIALDWAGNVLVVDRQANQVHKLSATGERHWSVGSLGDGPGEFRGPCCPLPQRDGTVFVLSPNAKRLERLGSEGEVLERRYIETSLSLLSQTPAVLDDGTVVLTAYRLERPAPTEPNTITLMFVEADRDGGVSTRPFPAPLPEDSMGIIRPTYPRGTVGANVVVPFSPVQLVILVMDGSYLWVRTSRYHLIHEERNGRHRGEVVREVLGERLTTSERTLGEEGLSEASARVRSVGGSVPATELPVAKPPVENVWIDNEGRIWVQHYARTGDGLVQADVYTPRHEPLFRAHWDADIDLSHGAARGTVAWGRRLGGFGEHVLVRVDFRDDGANW